MGNQHTVNPRTLLERLFAKARIDAVSGCWVWTGGLNGKGYGLVWSAGKTLLVHRVAYEELVGPIPEGLTLDHLCRNRPCFNVDHLEPVTHRENVRRGIKGVLTTHCPQGHPYDEPNTRWSRGKRHCRACHRRWRAQREHNTQAVWLW